MGEVASVDYGASEHKDCDKCGMEQKDGCCHTEHKMVKADGDHLFVKSFTGFTAWIPELASFDFNHTISLSARDHHHSRYHSPPDGRSNTLRLYNGVFRV
jgi:hypothetical protein